MLYTLYSLASLTPCRERDAYTQAHYPRRMRKIAHDTYRDLNFSSSLSRDVRPVHNAKPRRGRGTSTPMGRDDGATSTRELLPEQQQLQHRNAHLLRRRRQGGLCGERRVPFERDARR